MHDFKNDTNNAHPPHSIPKMIKDNAQKKMPET